MRVVLSFLSIAALAGCSGERSAQRTAETDINAAAADAQGDIDTYAANRLQAVRPAAPVVTPSAAATVSEPSPSMDDAQAAVAVVQHYYALIGERDYGAAWQLWDDDGRASGLSARQFADSFAKYAAYRAVPGAPGRVDAGAGQRYVEIPVRVTGTLANGGRPFVMAGNLILHRTADIDGATVEQQAWRIRDSSIRPRPTEATGGPAVIDTVYRCAGETRVSVRFDNDADTATIRRDGRDVAVLTGQRPASGIWYKGDGYELRGKGKEAELSRDGQTAQACTAD